MFRTRLQYRFYFSVTRLSFPGTSGRWEALLRANPAEDKATTIATDLGFTEVGRFSVRYRELFGESPLQTLHRRHRCIVAIPG